MKFRVRMDIAFDVYAEDMADAEQTIEETFGPEGHLTRSYDHLNIWADLRNSEIDIVSEDPNQKKLFDEMNCSTCGETQRNDGPFCNQTDDGGTQEVSTHYTCSKWYERT